jgi:WD40 repeat protein
MFELKRPFSRNLAVVIGINDYENGIAPLGTAFNDAQKLADILRSQPEPHNYEIVHLEEAQPGIESLKNLLDITLPNVIKPTEQDRLLFYFAGHGYPADSVEGPAGYLVPRDAQPGKMESFLPMEDLHSALLNLDCRHLLIILDCCFAGSFRWAVTRHIAAPTVMYRQRFERYTRHHAWQVITSAAHDQKAFDVLFDNRAEAGVEHSPFAEALFEALEKGTADVNGDGIVTATELYLHLSETLRDRTLELRQQQVPGLWPLKKHDKGEFIFILNENFNPENLDDAPPIDPENNPYRGLESFEAKQSNLFFGRDELIEELYERIALPDAKTNSDRPFTVVLGISGSGKSSLVKAGLIPHLNKQEAGLWQILEPMRPGTTPFLALAKAILLIANNTESVQDSIELLSQLLQDNPTQFSQTIAAWHKLNQNQGKKLLLVIDQFEELITQSQSSQIQQSQDSVEQKSEWQKFLDVLAVAIQAHAQHLRIVVTLRSDFEPRFLNSAFKEYWASARFPVRAMRADELRQAIEKPAEEKALFFKDPKLVDKLIEEVGQMPGALPLLSFTLSELYIQLTNKNREKGDTDRALTRDDDKFGQEGGIAGSLTRRANEVYEQIGEVENLGEAAQKTMRRVLLRMLTLEGGETTRRKVPKSELVYPTLEENERVKQVVNSLVDARLLVTGQLETGESYIEPAHDYLIRGWITLQNWIAQNQQSILLRNRLHFNLVEWKNNKSSTDHLWISNAQVATLNEILLSDMRYSLNDDEEKFVAQSIEKAQEVNTEKEKQVLEAFLLSSELLWKDNQQLESLIAITKAGKRLQAAKRAGLAPDNGILVRTKLYQTLYQRIREKNRFFAEGIVISIAFSPDGENIVTGSTFSRQRFGVYEDDDVAMKLWNLQGNILTRFPSADKCLAFSSDGETIASNSQLFNRQGKELLTVPDHRVICISFSSNGETIAIANSEAKARLLDLKGNQLSSFSFVDSEFVDRAIFPNYHYKVAFSPDLKMIATADNMPLVKLWNWQGRKLRILNGHNGIVHDVVFSHDGKMIASASADKTVKLWNLDGEEIVTFNGHNDHVTKVTFFADSRVIASVGLDKIVKLWNLDGNELFTFNSHNSHNNKVFDVTVSPDSKMIASASDDKTVRLWNLEQEQIPTFSSSCVAFSPDGETIALGNDSSVQLWNRQSLVEEFNRNRQGFIVPKVYENSYSCDDLNKYKGEGLLATILGDDSIVRVVYSPDGETIAASTSKTVSLWDREGVKLQKLELNDLSISDSKLRMAFSPNSDILAVTSKNNVILWDYKQGKELLTFSRHANVVTSVVFSSDGETIASGSNDITVKLWNRQGEELLTFDRHEVAVYDIAFSPDGETVASVSHEQVKLWNRKGEELLTFFPTEGKGERIYCVAFSPDGKLIAIAGSAGKVFVLNCQGGVILTLSGHGYNSNIYNVAFSPDGNFIASVSYRQVKLWDIGLGSLVTKSCDWLRDYLTNNPNVSASDRKLLEDIEQ